MRRFLFFLIILLISSIAANNLNAQMNGTFVGAKAGFLLSQKLALGLLADLSMTPQISIEPTLDATLYSNDKGTILRLSMELNGRYALPVQGKTFEGFAIAGPAYVIDRITGEYVGASPNKNFFRINLGGGICLNTRSEGQPFGGIKVNFDIGQGSDVQIFLGYRYYL